VIGFSSLQLADRLAELPLRLRPLSGAGDPAPCVTAAEWARVRILWPTSYAWVHAAGFTSTVRRSFARLGTFQLGEVRQDHRGVVSVRCEIDGRSHLLAIDYSDDPALINRNALAECSLYVKFQYREEGYDDSRIVAGGYPVSQLGYYRYYRAFRRRFAGRQRIDVLGRFSLEFQAALRSSAVNMLAGARDIRFVGTGPRVRYSRFLREGASARIGLDLPGNGPFTYRVAEFLGLGTCLVAPRYRAMLHAPLEPGVHYVEIASDLSDLLSVCRYYLSHEKERAAIAKAGQEYFDRYLHSDHLAAFYIRALLDRVDDVRPPVVLPQGTSLDQYRGFGVAESNTRHW
jgi:glycosyl transferase family 1